MRYPSKEYSDLVERKQQEIRGNVSSVKLSEPDMQKEISATTEGVFTEPVPIIEPTWQEKDLIAHMIKTGEVIAPVKRKRGRPPGSRNKKK